MTKQTVGVSFRPAGKIYCFDPGNLKLAVGDPVIVETVRGLEYGTIASGPAPYEGNGDEQPLKPVIRKADEDDRRRLEEIREKEKEAFRICVDKIAAHGLPMKLVSVDYTFDGNKIIFYFTADGRIDFRELVRDLAAVFRTRIELRQIGVRDEAKMMGGQGCCGRELCCASWLREFTPVSIRMAKEQNLSLNPAKISGICGRLMCCLKYESDTYEHAKKEMPVVGSSVITPKGEGKVTAVNMFKSTVTVGLKDAKEPEDFELRAVKTCGCPEKRG